MNEIVQEEPNEALDPETLGLFASIGIEKGNPFAPDARMKKILFDAAAVGNATSRATIFRSRMKYAYFYPDSMGSTKSGSVVNPDTSVDVYFGLTPSAGNEANWIANGSDKGWNELLRLYGPLQP